MTIGLCPMQNNILLFTILGLTFVIALSQIFIIILNSLKHNKPDQNIEDIYDPKSQEILHYAQQKAEKILANAELKGIEYISKQKMDIGKVQSEYEASVKDLESKLLNQFSQSLGKANQTYQGFLDILQENLRQQEIKNQRDFQDKTNHLIENAQTTMSNFIMDVNKKINRQIDDELKVVRNELEVYKKHRLEIINKYVIDILESILAETLNKKLTLKDHTDLIYQALEKAKTDHQLT